MKYNFFIEIREKPNEPELDVISFALTLANDNEVYRILTTIYHHYHIQSNSVYREYEIWGKYCTLFIYLDVLNDFYYNLYRLNKDAFLNDFLENVKNIAKFKN